MGKALQLVSGKHEFSFLLSRKKNVFGLSLFFNIWCCNYTQGAKDSGEFIMDEHRQNQKEKKNGKELYDNNTFNTLSIGQRGDQMDYYNRFKDCDSYNDYIINLDFIVGVKKTIFEKFSIKKPTISSSDKFEEVDEG